MQPDAAPPEPGRARRLVLLLSGTTVVLGAAGALWFTRFASHVRRDPALIYREPATLEKLLKRANDAERAGDTATAATTYRFVLAVGQGADADLTPYVAAARAGLTRLGAADSLPKPP